MAEQTAEYRCEICGATFKDPDALTKHRAVHGANVPEKEDLEQGTQSPMLNPSMPDEPPTPGPMLPPE